MASFLPPSSSLNPSFPLKKELIKYPNVRCQSFKEEGIVDANMGILKGRIAEVRMKDRLDGWSGSKIGRIYQSANYDHKYQRDIAMLSQSLELMGIVSGALGFVFLSGSLCICLVSLLVHLSR